MEIQGTVNTGEGSSNSNLILVSSHDGPLQPASIPNRDAGCYFNGSCIFSHECVKQGMMKDVRCAVKDTVDAYTKEIAVMLADQLTLITNEKPHVVLNNLHRNKIDFK